MLVIRMQRTGRKGHAMFRVIVQDSRLTPTSGKVVAHLGNYDPHAKSVVLDKEKAAFYLEHGAQPSERVARLLKSEGVKLPSWVTVDDSKTSKIRNLEKLRRNRPAEEVVVEEAPAADADTADTPEAVEEAPAAEAPEAVVTETPDESAKEPEA